MPQRKYLPLKPSEVERVLKALGFEFKRMRGAHAQWEGYVSGERKVATVDRAYDQLDVKLMKLIIRQQLNITPEEFYGADGKIAKRYRG